MTDDATGRLLDRFLAAIRPVVPVVSVWAHGSLAGGDYQPGRSDLDLIAVLDRPCTSEEERLIEEAHEHLGSAMSLASKLHCSYVATAEAADPARPHLTWAQEELMRRPVTPVTRRELHAFGLVLHGEAPESILPAVTDGELTDFVISDLGDFWQPSLEHPEWYLNDIWVDLGMLTLARATVTLREGRLITKREALDVLGDLDAPVEVIDDIRRRRYGTHTASTEEWLIHRAGLTLAFLGSAIDRAVTAHRSDRGDDLAPRSSEHL
ncbi:nucleotidyltransferase domain-containing protein [Sphaerisporangium dianthi]|uniref:Nucleotidyltransferase domain-containing protein n=1 Tax=Sphaerisporangium dianthi TaxID=1436120 RepID=A0ABV9CHM0_9ACTN